MISILNVLPDNFNGEVITGRRITTVNAIEVVSGIVVKQELIPVGNGPTPLPDMMGWDVYKLEEWLKDPFNRVINMYRK